MRFRPLVVLVALSALTGCMFTARAEHVVRASAVHDTSCADVEITRGDDGLYVARGCGKIERYACDRPAGTGCSKPGAVSAAGCRKIAASEPSKP